MTTETKTGNETVSQRGGQRLPAKLQLLAVLAVVCLGSRQPDIPGSNKSADQAIDKEKEAGKGEGKDRGPAAQARTKN